VIGVTARPHSDRYADPAHAMTFTVTTWNVENFSPDAPNYDAKRAYLAETISDLGSDVVAVQEVLDATALEALAADLGFVAVAGEPDSRDNRVGFLLRAAPLAPARTIKTWRLHEGALVQELDADMHVQTVQSMPRPALAVTVQAGARQITLINVHLKSKLLTFPNGAFSTTNETLRAGVAYFAIQRRAAESKTIREEVTDLLQAGQEVIVLGDLNDGANAATTEILYGPGGSQPQSPNEQKNGAFHKQDGGDRRRLFNVTGLVPLEARWTRKYKGQNELIDHILVGEKLMAPRNGELRAVPAVRIDNEDAPSMDDAPRLDGVVPDHAPVTAVFGQF
jgi:endonuclease/exonuclease/phosphatase family metal-dependent hydrolase